MIVTHDPNETATDPSAERNRKFFNEQIMSFSLSHVFHIDFQLEGGLSSPIFFVSVLADEAARRYFAHLRIFFSFVFVCLQPTRSYLHD